MGLTTWTAGIGILIYFIFSGLIVTGIAVEKKNIYNEIQYNTTSNISQLDSSLNLTSEVTASNTMSFMKALHLTITEDLGFFGNLIFVFLPSIFLVIWVIFVIRGLP